MKKYSLLLLILPFFLGSCESWLDVRPFDRLEVERVFPDEQTTNSALNGLYVSLSLDSLYGRDMLCGATEVMAQHFNVPYVAGESNENQYYQLAQYNYEHKNAKKVFSRMFQAAYKTIADCNEFMEWVENGKNNYPTDKYNQYIGEALGVRTYLHFDMLRLFGPMSDELSALSVPYYSFSTDTPRPILSANDLVDSLLRDIDLSIGHLKNDPILTSGSQIDRVKEVDFFSSYRTLRMNFYAANALKARMLLYRGDEQSRNEAYSIATSLIEGRNPADPAAGSTNFPQEIKFEITQINEFVFDDEIIFGFHNSRRKDVHRELFSSDLDVSRILTGGVSFIESLYGKSSGALGGEDLGPRPEMWNYNSLTATYEFLRYGEFVSSAYRPYHNEVMCLFRLGELYAIAAETAPDLETKRQWLDNLRAGRGYDPQNTTGLTDAQLDQLLSIEFEKETYGEGQFFFFAKRLGANLKNQNGAAVTMDKGRYVPALPEGEMNLRE